MTPPTGLREVSVANLTIGRMDPGHFIEEAAAAGFGAVGLFAGRRDAKAAQTRNRRPPRGHPRHESGASIHGSARFRRGSVHDGNFLLQRKAHKVL
jgi:hypothetical protein